MQNSDATWPPSQQLPPTALFPWQSLCLASACYNTKEVGCNGGCNSKYVILISTIWNIFWEIFNTYVFGILDSTQVAKAASQHSWRCGSRWHLLFREAIVKYTAVCILVIRLDCAQSVLAAICSLIVTECIVVQTEALLYLCEKVYDFYEVPWRKLSAYCKSLNQCNTSVQ